MAKMVMHIDGSAVKHKGRTWFLGWSLVIQEQDAHVECAGVRTVTQASCGLHEVVAFVEAVAFVHGRGMPFEEVALYTDDEKIGYAPFHLHPDNFSGHHAQNLNRLLHRAVQICGMPVSMVNVCEEFLTKARVHKVKGHSRLVYQERADHLARAAARAMTDTPFESLSFAEWLQKGVMFYTSNEATAQFWHPAFCKPQASNEQSCEQSEPLAAA